VENNNYAQQYQTTSDFLYTHLRADCVLLRHEVTLPRYINTPLLTNRQGYEIPRLWKQLKFLLLAIVGLILESSSNASPYGVAYNDSGT